MRVGTLLAVGVAMCLLPAVSFAQQSAPAAPPKAPVEIDQLKPQVVIGSVESVGAGEYHFVGRHGIGGFH